LARESRAEVGIWAERLVGSGYVLVSIDYRLAPETKLEGIVSDVEDAFRWIRQRGLALFHGDPAELVVMGPSAGGYLTLVSGYRIQPRPKALVVLFGYSDLLGPWLTGPSQNKRHYESKLAREDAHRFVPGPPVTDPRQRPHSVNAFYAFCRRQGLWPQELTGWNPRTETAKFLPYLPLQNVTADYPPTLLIHGTADTDVPYEQSVQMSAELKKHHIEHRLITVPGAEHSLAGADPKTMNEVNDAIMAFIQKHIPVR